MWKVLLVISAVVLAGSGVISWTNQKTLADTRLKREQEQTRVDRLEKDLANKKVKLEETVANVATLKDEAQKLQVEVDTVKAKVSENDLMINNLKTQTDAATNGLAEAKKFLAEMGNAQRVQESMATLKNQIEQEQIQVAGLEQNVLAAKNRKEQLDKIAAELAALKKDQEEGRIRPEFNSSIKRAYNQWGFVVIEGGNDQGVVKRAQLDVSRRGQPICKLLVTSVEPQESIAEVIPGSMVPGQTIQEGDDVTKSAARMPLPGEIPAPPKSSTAPPAGAGGAAPAPPAGGMGGMEGGAPAPAPSDDPFGAPAGGGGMEGGAPAPAPSDDPFAQ